MRTHKRNLNPNKICSLHIYTNDTLTNCKEFDPIYVHHMQQHKKNTWRLAGPRMVSSTRHTPTRVPTTINYNPTETQEYMKTLQIDPNGSIPNRGNIQRTEDPSGFKDVYEYRDGQQGGSVLQGDYRIKTKERVTRCIPAVYTTRYN